MSGIDCAEWENVDPLADNYYSDDFDVLDNNQKPSINDINILFLGPTGVGKSTFINAIDNYLNFASLEDALNSPELRYLIPASFTTKGVKVTVGSETEHEFFNACRSATQTAKHYSYTFEDRAINIIDTPGLGDTEGLEKDKQNVVEIFNYLKKFKILHGIVVFMKPSEGRYTEYLKNVISELFSNLHKNATSNISFCLTHAHGTFYEPGDTLNFLQLFCEDLRQQSGIKIELDEKKNIYCVDNQAFHYLCGKKNGVEYPKKDLKRYTEAWDESKTTLLKLFVDVSKNEPHYVEGTLAVNEAKLIVPILIDIIKHIVEGVETNSKILQEKLKYIETLNEFTENLQEKLHVEEFVFTAKQNKWTQVICTKCEDKNFGDDGSVKTTKKHCGGLISTVAINGFWAAAGVGSLATTKNPLFISPILESFSCSACKCGWTWHKRTKTTYEWTPVKKLNKKVEDLLAQKGNEKEAINEQIKELNQRIAQFNNEHESLLKSAAKLTQYIDGNSMYANFCGATKSVIATIRRTKATTPTKMTPTDIFNIRNELFELPIFGCKIKEMFDEKLGSKHKLATQILENYRSKMVSPELTTSI